MGKAALILVTAVTVVSGITYMNQDRQAYEAVMQEVLYEHGLLAREVAKSGFNTVMSRVRNDFDNYRVNKADQLHQRGTMDMSATGTGGGPVAVSVTGYVEGSEFTINGTLERNGGRLLDALTVDGPLKKFEIKDNADISGLDTNPDGTDGSNADVHAVLSTIAASHELVIEGISSAPASGVDGLGDAVQDSPDVSLAGLVTSINAYEGTNLDTYTGKTKFEDTTIGNEESPRVVRVSGDVEMKGSTTGYGILYVEGDLKMEGNARWEGLIIATAEKGKFEIKGDARVYGAMIVSANSEDGPGGDSSGGGGLPGGHFDIDAFDMVASTTGEIYHEHQYDDDYNVTGVNLLAPNGCKTDGGLCLTQVVGSTGSVYVEFFNAGNSRGSYRIKDGTKDLTGNPADGLAKTEIDLSTLEEFWVEFDALCYLQESSPGDVQSDAVTRNGAFTIKVYGAADGYSAIPGASDAHLAGFGATAWFNAVAARVTALFDDQKITICHIPPGNPENQHTLSVSESSWPAHDAHGDSTGACAADESPAPAVDDGGGSLPGNLIYELAVYHHTNADFPCGTASPAEGAGDEGTAYGKPVEVKLKDDALIQYSSRALSQAISQLAGYALGPGVITLTDVSESGVRSRTRLKASLDR